MKKTFSMLLISMFICALILAGCGKKQNEEDGSKWTIGMSQCNLGEPWRVQMNADIKDAADQHPELKVIFKDAQND